MSDIDTLQTQVRCLENEVKGLQMTLRDQFAMASMAQVGESMAGASVTTLEQAMSEIARLSYLMADAFLEARK